MKLSLYTLDGPFKVLSTHEVSTVDEAMVIVRAHATTGNFTNVRTKDDEDYSLRFIADPIKGRKGRNIASMDCF